jgi:glutaredoxin
MYNFKIISLFDCPYSEAGEKLMSKYNTKVINISRDEKHNYKTEQIQTFPQIYFNTGYQELLIGGYNDMKTLLDKVNNLNTKNLNVAINILKKYNWDDKDKKRLLKLLL